MKNIIIVSVLVLLALQTQAQTEKGTVNLGLNFQILNQNYNNTSVDPLTNTQSTQSSKNTVFSIGPNFNYFICNALDIGANIGYSHSNTDNFYTISQKQVASFASASVYARKYFMYQNKIGIRTGPYATYAFGDEKTTNGAGYSIYDINAKVKQYNLGANLDLLYYPLKSLGIAASIVNFSYNHYKKDDDKANHEEQDSLNFSMMTNVLAFSVFYVFGGK